MLDPSSALVVYQSILDFVDAGANTLDKAGKSASSSQDVIDVEHRAQALKDVETRGDTSATSKSAPDIKQTEPEKATQKIYERVKTFADRLVPALQPYKRPGTSDSVKSPDAPKKEKADIEKLKKENENLRLETARSLVQLLSERCRRIGCIEDWLTRYR